MIHRIVVENFYSVADRQELNFRVPANAPDLAAFRGAPSDPDHRLPVVIGLFGPNASGKSTTLRTLISAGTFIVSSFSSPPDGPVALFSPYASGDWWERPSTLVIEYDGRIGEGAPASVVRYEVQISNDPKKFACDVLYEGLFHAPQGKFRRVFERHRQQFSFGRDFGITSGDPRLLSIRPNASVISTLAQFNHKPSSDLIQALQGLQTNIVGLGKNSGGLNPILPLYAQHPNYLQRLNAELSRLDLGLEEMKIQRGDAGLVATFRHTGLGCELLAAQESMGTQRFIEWFPRLLYVLDHGGVAVLDEMDADIHPLLMPELFRWFYDGIRNPNGAQLLFTAHNPSMLDDLEKEQVFFSEKRSGEPTRLYGARDIKGLRREPSLMKKYLSGELGAVPHIG